MLVHHLLGDPEFQCDYYQNWHGRLLRPCLWSLLVTTAKMTHFRGQTSPNVGKPPISLIFVCYSPPSVLMIWNSNLIFVKNFNGRLLRSYWWSQFVTTARMTPFRDQTSHKTGKTPFRQFSCVIVHHLFWWPRMLTSFLPKSHLYVHSDLSYGVGWSSRIKWSIFRINNY